MSAAMGGTTGSKLRWLPALLLLVGVAHAQQIGSLVPGCQPAYWTMEPDVTVIESWQFEVKIQDAKTHVIRYRADHVHVTRACCQWSHAIVTETLSHLNDRTAKVTVGDCR